MGYDLRAFIASDLLLLAHAANHRSIRVVPLAQALAMAPLTVQLHDEIAESGGELGPRAVTKPRPFEARRFLGRAAVAWVERLSWDGPVAYVEAQYAGGAGMQSAVTWREGHVALGPVETKWREPLPTAAINRALCYLGAEKDGYADEFEAVGLNLRRETDDWFDEAPGLRTQPPRST